MTTVPKVTDPRLRNWQKLLQKYQNQVGADSRNNLKLSEPLRRVQVKLLKAMSRSQGDPYNVTTLRRLEAKMIRTVLQQ